MAENAGPALIESDLFAVAQEQLAENRQRNRQTRRGQRYLLQGLLVCRRCGYAYYGKAISLRAERESGATMPITAAAAATPIALRSAPVRQPATVDRSRRCGGLAGSAAASPDPRHDRGRVPAAPASGPTPGSRSPDLVTAEAQIAKLRRGIARLIDGYTEGLIEKAEFEQRVTGLRQRIKTWEQQAATLQDEAALRRTLSLIIGRLEDFAKQVRQRMDARIGRCSAT